jgi:preprotein translocase subunit Sss1
MDTNPYESRREAGNTPERDEPKKLVSVRGLAIAFAVVIGFLVFIALWDLAAMVIGTGWPKN